MFHVEHILKNFFDNKDLVSLVKRFELLKELYFKWNKVYNISSIRDEEGFWIKHVLDSLCLAKYISDNSYKGDILDVGSGGGFPAIVLAVVLQENKVLALEPIIKKTDFIDHCVNKLELNNLSTINSKFQSLNSPFDIVVSRALGRYNEICQHFFGLEEKTKIVLMTTSESLEQLKYQHKIINYPYEACRDFAAEKLRDHILCECYNIKKSN
jgi:16S rRNA (guanine(527)-N(7))-methyltransferase RsmG